MPVHTIRIEATAPVSEIELQSAATWARGPGRALSFSADGAGAGTASMDVNDRVARLRREATGTGILRATIQVATAEERLTIKVHTEGAGSLAVSTDNDRCVSRSEPQGSNSETFVLFLKADGET